MYIPSYYPSAMVENKRLLLVESDERLGQFLEESLEDYLCGESNNVSVTEVDPNAVPDDVMEVTY